MVYIMRIYVDSGCRDTEAQYVFRNSLFLLSSACEATLPSLTFHITCTFEIEVGSRLLIRSYHQGNDRRSSQRHGWKEWPTTCLAATTTRRPAAYTTKVLAYSHYIGSGTRA